MMQLIINADGRVRCLYDEHLDLSLLGDLHIARAGGVEPDRHGQWWADLSPAGGPVLGPFARRSDAIAAEVRWLRQHCL